MSTSTLRRPLVILHGTVSDPCVPPPGSPDFWAYVGQNSGNLLYRYAIEHALAPSVRRTGQIPALHH